MTEKLMGCDVIRHADNSTTIVSPLVALYADVRPVESKERKFLHGNSNLVKERYRDVHAALRGSNG